MSTTLEVPTRLRVTDGADPANSARTSVTHFEPPEGAGNTLADGLRPGDSSHESTQEVPGAPEQKADAAEEPSGAPTESQLPQSPQVYLTFLLISGRRRTMSFEPGTTLGRVKELVWNSWPSDWVDERPTGPSYLRVLYLGRMLQDDETLSQLNFSTHTLQSTTAPTPTIVHLSIRPFAMQGDPDMKKKRNRNRLSDGQNVVDGEQADESGDAGCCNCVIC